MVEQLTMTGVTLLDDDNVVALLSTLLKSYEGLVVSLSQQNVLTLQIVIKLFLRKEVKIKSNQGKCLEQESP
jgi:hypothetical protein